MRMVALAHQAIVAFTDTYQGNAVALILRAEGVQVKKCNNLDEVLSTINLAVPDVCIMDPNLETHCGDSINPAIQVREALSKYDPDKQRLITLTGSRTAYEECKKRGIEVYVKGDPSIIRILKGQQAS